MKRILVVFGTRPEAIKLAPVIRELRRRSERFEPIVCITAQHRRMLDQVLDLFQIEVRHDLDLMKAGQDLTDITCGVLHGLREILASERPDMLLAQGDTTTAMAAAVERFVLDGQQARITQASLETLAVVAYRQPVSRARISAVRGVNVDGVMRTLLARGLVEECGSESDTGAHLYRTTHYFLERLGIASLEELPELAPYLPDLESLEAEL